MVRGCNSGAFPPSATTSGLQHKLEALFLFPTAIRGFKAGGPLYAYKLPPNLQVASFWAGGGQARLYPQGPLPRTFPRPRQGFLELSYSILGLGKCLVGSRCPKTG